MHIKRVTIKGFRSYREQTFVEPFSPHHNVIVGRNGSGKSNFFFAIRFVLSDAFASLRAEERQRLLHEGAGHAVMSAYVEIVFDNSDERIPTDRDEVTLRRSIGVKNDDYYLDFKRVNRSEVLNLLESAGFSRSNPYYIVQQGKINALATATDAERLKLLMEVAGTSVYDDRRKESLDILDDTHNKRQRIEEVLMDIERRLEELEEEKQELSEYQALDKEKRSLEYAIYSDELQQHKERLEEVERKRQEISQQNLENNKSNAEMSKQIADYTEEINTIAQLTDRLDDQIAALAAEQQQKQRQLADLNISLTEEEQAVAESNTTRKSALTEYKQVQKRLQKRRKELEAILPTYITLKENKASISAQLNDCQQRHEDILRRQTRGTMYGSVEERDRHLSREIADLKEAKATDTAEAQSLARERKQKEKQLKKERKRLQEAQENIKSRRAGLEQVASKLNDLRVERNQAQNEKRRAQQAAEEVGAELSTIADHIRSCEKKLLDTANRPLRQGLASVEQVVADHGIDGVHGPLLKLITVTEQFLVAADVTGGNALFNIVVDTDQTASRILQHMNEKRLPGRVSFLPLNRLRPSTATLPPSDEYTPLVDYIAADQRFLPAVKHVFGKTFVCRELKVAQRVADQHNIDAITLEGDRVSRKNVIKGGWVDDRTNRLMLQQDIAHYAHQHTAKKAKYDELASNVAKAEQHVTNVVSKVSNAEESISKEKNAIESAQADAAPLQQSISQLEAAVPELEEQVAALTDKIARTQSRIDSLETEMGSDLESQLDQDAQQTLASLSEEIEQARTNLHAIITELSDVEQQKDTLESEINGHLEKRKQQLEQELETSDEVLKGTAIETLKTQISNTDEDLAKLKQELRAKEAERTNKEEKKSKLESEVKKLLAEQTQRDAGSDHTDEELTQLLAKRSQLREKKEKLLAQIRDLGALPSDAFQKYAETDIKTLYSKLQRVNKKLKKYSHVNKKALDQYISFSEQRDALVSRKDQQDSGDSAITELIQVLDAQKHEAINLTFKQVASHFKAVFKELVPHGEASLVMQRADPTAESQESGTLSAPDSDVPAHVRLRQTTTTAYSGVAIRVNFTGKGEDTHMLQQLSGGQKSLVALALIFAIQRCDPGPFYLFDEVDQALDPAHRSAVARMIYKASRDAQYITTTFRPELLERCDKVYGVTFANKVSHINVVSKEEAQTFIDESQD
ncbi:hypothetical protein PTSG_07983 [Salpingoeca rosetta]|uniref:Structural maintenance of chromosomes protein n=1 Tax=Salpingoeca rosetta (strain ATCC 50818 / BSB-021) TaxID=946362 RepID=F2UGW9_SALR5|nr:uncharacterized protein PTSG_07983 [Salpingoeca rosetta]EGD75869.1 hypothetical protein PTSG_07983 [Salpingoeca rosetta]|eukprot:XP_004991790.1 hypothetical protein PTSG_07983 [Salpingoeca rosetta]